MRRWEWRVKRGKELRGGEEYLYIIYDIIIVVSRQDKSRSADDGEESRGGIMSLMDVMMRKDLLL